MPFDPTKPADNTPLDAAEMRSQLIAIKAQLDALSAHVDDIVNSYNTTLVDIENTESTDIAGTSRSTNAVALLSLSVSDPPNQSQVQTIADKVDEMLNAQRR